MRFYASGSDTVVGKAQNTDVTKAIVNTYCRESTVIATTGNHGDPSNFVPSEYVAFAARCFRDVATGFSETIPKRVLRSVALQKGRWD
jgi:hypothetical protein